MRTYRWFIQSPAKYSICKYLPFSKQFPTMTSQMALCHKPSAAVRSPMCCLMMRWGLQVWVGPDIWIQTCLDLENICIYPSLLHSACLSLRNKCMATQRFHMSSFRIILPLLIKYSTIKKRHDEKGTQRSFS